MQLPCSSWQAPCPCLTASLGLEFQNLPIQKIGVAADWDREFAREYYYNELNGLNYIDLPVCKCAHEDHAWHLFPAIILPEAPVTRNDFIQIMANKGIGTSVHYKPLHRMSYYQETYKLEPDDFPGTEKIWKGTVSLPIYPDLKDHELEFICKSIKEILN